jgi:hypothetical protein
MACRLKSVLPGIDGACLQGEPATRPLVTEIAGEPIRLMLYTRDRWRDDR